jgi:hypothetical protein
MVPDTSSKTTLKTATNKDLRRIENIRVPKFGAKIRCRLLKTENVLKKDNGFWRRISGEPSSFP